jgi:hypothetical protein
MPDQGTSGFGSCIVLCLAFACSGAVESGLENGDNDGDSPPDDRPLTDPIGLTDTTLAAYDHVLDRAYVTSGPRLRALALAGGQPFDLFEAGGVIVALTATPHGVSLVATLADQRAQLVQVTHEGAVELDLELSMAEPGPGFAALPIIRVMDSGTLVVLDGLGNAGVHAIVVDAPSAEARPSNAVYTFIYQDPGVAVRGETLYLPSAYPGEVVQASVNSTGVLDETRRIEVTQDWLHDVALLGEDRAVVAGHLAGVGVIELNDSSEPARYTPISDLLWAYSLVGDDHVYSAANASLICVDARSFVAWTLTIPGFSESPIHNTTVPIGERAPGRVLVHQPGAGLVELDCAAARR